MAQFYLIPSWFFGFGLILEVLFGIITLAVAAYSFLVYKYCLEREFKLFGFGFLALAFSYFSWAFVSWYIPFKIGDVQEIVSLDGFSGLIGIGVYAHAFLFLIGLTTLTYLTFDIKGKRNYGLLLSLVLILLVFAEQKIVAFYFTSALLMLYVLFYYGRGYVDGEGPKNPFLLLAFFFLFLGSVDFTLSAVNHVHYVVGHVFYLIGYGFILVNFVVMLKPIRRGDERREKDGKKER
ncbi:hypothetical protein CO038_02470 [Candidatus Pacearchaeota archaeon CG_4_9_14_0_2_um_filter_39_13]|nr:hypothetical protein [Candidatus Pacearchaeota archaeon]OIO43951.1 MAG: hypothetical protein AUJ64_01525 [Candidatus Pacearchaeota archaeon CG1_02_39_14]PJC44804.1 MAG: hypothetical protein CO038_02470 [Candidatus Pacearchaeota archaeon CG_4_9_14_0_2_um_filter_39_13]